MTESAITPAQAAQWYADAYATNDAVHLARLLVGTERTHHQDGRSVDDLLFEAQERSAHLCRGLAGASPLPDSAQITPSAIPLETLDTPHTRRLLALLMEAQEVAEQIDWERGRALDESVPLLPGESRGTDLAESISEIALRVRTEVHGPRGRE
jgi:hypothetical protein